MAKTIALLGAMDTKGAEYAFVKGCIESRGHRTLLIDVGILGPPAVAPDIPRNRVAELGGADLEGLVRRQDRGESVAVMARGAEVLIGELHRAGKLDAILALGGTGGTSVACAAMRALPLGVPKVMVSTVAGKDVSGYVGVKDIVMIPSIVDVSGINRVSRDVFAKAAGAVCGMVETEVPAGEDRPLVAASMFGNTTRCVEAAKPILEQAGYEVLVFHATGTGGRTMESLIEAGLIAGVFDVTTTEWADELVGGVMGAGPTRLEAAARRGVPAVVTPGCLDMVEFLGPGHCAGKVSRTTVLSAQSEHHPHADHARGMPAVGRNPCGKVELKHGSGQRVAAAGRMEYDRRAGRSLLAAGSRSGAGRRAEEPSPAGHPRDRIGLQRERSRIRPTRGGNIAGEHQTE